MEAVARILEDDHERVPLESAGSQLAKDHGGADGAVFLRGRRETAGRIRAAQGQGLINRQPVRHRMLDRQAWADGETQFSMRLADGELHFFCGTSLREEESQIA